MSLLVAFGGGLLSFLSPCVLPMAPVYLSSLYGPEIFNGQGFRLPVFLHALSFVLGFAIVFSTLGAIIGITGSAIIPDFVLLEDIAGGLLIAFGVFILLSMRISWLNFEKRFARAPAAAPGYARSLLVGAAFSVSWTACVGPILSSVLTIAATRETAWRGAYLLGVYSLGLGLPFLAIGIAFDFLLPVMKKIQKYSGIIRVVSGLLLITIGMLMLLGKLTWFSTLAA